MADERKQLHDAVERALKRGDMAEAASACRRLAALNPNDQALLQRLADIQARAGQDTEARDTFLRLAEEYWKAGYAQRGLAALRRASKLGAADPTILSLLGQRLLETGLLADARDPLLNSARLWEQKGNRVQAGSLFSQVAELLPKDLPSREGLARLADKWGTPAERAAARVQLALARLRGGDLATALRLVGEALEVDHEGMSALDTLPELLVAVSGMDLTSLPDTPGSLSPEAAAGWAVVRIALAQRLGLGGQAGDAVKRFLAGKEGLHPRVRLWAGRVLLEQDDLDGATEALLGLESEVAWKPKLVEELVEAVSALVTRNPGDQRAMDLLLRLTISEEDRTGGQAGAPGAAEAPEAAPTPASPGWSAYPPSPEDEIATTPVVATGAVPAAPPPRRDAPVYRKYADREEDRRPEPSSPEAGAPLSFEAQARLLEAQALVRQGLMHEARNALESIDPALRDHPAVAELWALVRPTRAPARGAAPSAEAADDDAMFVFMDEDAEDRAAATPPEAPPAEPPPALAPPAAPSAIDVSLAGIDLAQLEHSINKAVDPGDAEMNYQMALGLVEMGLYDQAAPLLEPVLGDPARRVDAVVLLSRVRAAAGQQERAYQEALAVYFAADQLAPSLRAELLAVLAELALQTDRVKDAVVFQRELTRLEPRHPAARRLQERIALASGQRSA